MTFVTSPVDKPVLRLCGITKRFGALMANDAVSLEVHRGEILALLGENGAGKSTLMSILFGHYRADEGYIEVFGERLPPGQPRAALGAGIGMVHQHFTLADNLSVLDNVMVGTEPLWALRSRRAAARARLLEVAERFGLAVDPEARVGDLSVGERQRVEIVKALFRGARILILDEPTAVLTPQESDQLFEVLASMVRKGLAIIFISHKLPEVMRVAHRVAVLRHGRLVAQARTADVDVELLTRWMVGHSIELPPRQPARQIGGPVCELRDVCVAADRNGRGGLKHVNLSVRAGEIVAIAGVSGNGQATLADVLCGLRRPSSGEIILRGQPWRAQPRWLVRRGVARIPEDRHGTGVVGDLSLWENAISEHLHHPRFTRMGWIRRTRALAFAQEVLKQFDVRGGALHHKARMLSGGNMQKLIIGRALSDPGSDRGVVCEAKSLIIAHQPTWGLDVGAVHTIVQRLRAARDAGAAVVLISDDLDEVLALGDRIAVMHGGKLSEARPNEDWSRASIGLAMAGAA